MTKQDLKPIYAENNREWRIRYQSNGFWELQEFLELHDGVDRRIHQDWITHNTRMSYEDAIVRLAGYAKPVRRAA